MNRSVLIVDDDDHVREALNRLLRRERCDVHTADGGASALESLSSFEPAVIICDERMPGMPGSKVLAEAARLRPDTYRISLTAYAELRAMQTLINEGHIHRFMLKPWDDAQVRIAVEEGFRTYRLIQENRELQALTGRQKAALEEWNGRLQDRVREQTATLQEQNRTLTELRQRLEESLRDTVSVLAGILEAVSLNLGTHSKRVAELAVLLGSRLGLPAEELRDVEFAAYLHELGRVSTGPILTARRPPAHTRPNNELQYALSGYAILSRVTGFENIARGVRHQGERFDGKGQPDRLAGQEIPVASRIIRAADTYDNATFSPNDPATLCQDTGRKALLEQKGKGLDPQLVDILLESINSSSAFISEESEVEVTVGQLSAGMLLARDLTTPEGVLLLAKGTQLTPDLIDRIFEFTAVDPVMTRICVRCTVREQASAGTTLPTAPEAHSRREADAKPPPCNDGAQRHHVPHPGELPQQPAESTKAPVREVLIVAESMLAGNTLGWELSLAGLSVRVASNAPSALQLLRNGRFDVAIVDIAMPRLAAPESVRRLASQHPDLPCIVLISQPTRQEVLYLSKLPNVRGVLVESWKTSRLIEMLASACETENPAYCQESA